MLANRRKPRGGAGGKIALPPPSPSPSPPLTCRILQERRALRKLRGPNSLSDEPPDPSLPCARPVPLSSKGIAQQKKATVIARKTANPCREPGNVTAFRKPSFCRDPSVLPRTNFSSSAMNAGLDADLIHAPNPHTEKATGVRHLTMRKRHVQTLALNDKDSLLTQENHILPSELKQHPIQRISLAHGFSEQVLPVSLCSWEKFVHDSSRDEDERHTLDSRSICTEVMYNWPCKADPGAGEFGSNTYTYAHTCDDDKERNAKVGIRLKRWGNETLSDIFHEGVLDLTRASYANSSIQEVNDTSSSRDAEQILTTSLRSLSLYEGEGSCADQTMVPGPISVHSDVSSLHSISEEVNAFTWQKLRGRGKQAVCHSSCSDVDDCTTASRSCMPYQEFKDTKNNINAHQKPDGFGNLVMSDRQRSDGVKSLFLHQPHACPQGLGNTDSSMNVCNLPKSQSNQAMLDSSLSDFDFCRFSLGSNDDIDNSCDGRNVECGGYLACKQEGIQNALNGIYDASPNDEDAGSLQKKLALLDGAVSQSAASLKEATAELGARIYDHDILLSSIQKKLYDVGKLVAHLGET